MSSQLMITETYLRGYTSEVLRRLNLAGVDGNGELVGIACAVCFAVTLGLALMTHADAIATAIANAMSAAIGQIKVAG